MPSRARQKEPVCASLRFTATSASSRTIPLSFSSVFSYVRRSCVSLSVPVSSYSVSPLFSKLLRCGYAISDVRANYLSSFLLPPFLFLHPPAIKPSLLLSFSLYICYTLLGQLSFGDRKFCSKPCSCPPHTHTPLSHLSPLPVHVPLIPQIELVGVFHRRLEHFWSCSSRLPLTLGHLEVNSHLDAKGQEKKMDSRNWRSPSLLHRHPRYSVPSSPLPPSFFFFIISEDGVPHFGLLVLHCHSSLGDRGESRSSNRCLSFSCRCHPLSTSIPSHHFPTLFRFCFLSVIF